VADFVRKYGYFEIPYSDLLKFIEKHEEYKTLEVIKTDKIVAVARWNIDGDTAKDIDVIVHPDYRNKRLLKLLLLRGLRRFPETKYLIYQREFKSRSNERRINVMKMLGVK